MKLSMFGTGYVGLVSGVCFADLGNDVICADIDSAKIQLLERGATPIFEPGLQERMERSTKEGRLSFTEDLKAAVESSDILFICVGTPPAKDGGVDLQYVESVAKTIGKYLNDKKIIVNKSTVPVGTATRVEQIIAAELQQRNVKHNFHVVSNPEFLREGAAVYDFFNPDRIVIGAEDPEAEATMKKLYRGVARTNRPIVITERKSAEMIKYASNAMLAARISFINQLSHYCEKVGADITAVSKGVGLDTRIGPRFLHAGIGYGGSCFPKDVQGLIASLEAEGCDATLLNAVEAANQQQKESAFPKIIELLGSIEGKKIAIWGLSFKPKTDDIREAPALTIVHWLQEQDAIITAFDPKAMEHFKKEYPDITYADNLYATLEDAELLLLLTEWDEFRNPDWERIKKTMRTPNIIDGRNIYTNYREDLKRLGFAYRGIGVQSI